MTSPSARARISARVLPTFLAASLVLAPAAARAEDVDLSSSTTEELKAEREDIGLGGPIALLSVGGALFLLGVPFLLAGATTSSVCSGYNDACSNAGTGVLIVGASMMTAGAGMGIGGGLWLGSRIGERRAIDRELKQRDSTATLLPATFHYGVAPTPDGFAAGFGGTF